MRLFYLLSTLSIMAGGCDDDDAQDCRMAANACSPMFECREQDGRWSCRSGEGEPLSEGAFGQPCELPDNQTIRLACDGPEASCALRNFVGCDDSVCLVYRDSAPVCSVECESDVDCDAGASCRSLLPQDSADRCQPDDGFDSECYCVRNADLGE